MKEPGCCMHNKMIECSGDFRPCHKCGWNPDIHEKRLQKIAAKKTKQAKVKA